MLTFSTNSQGIKSNDCYCSSLCIPAGDSPHQPGGPVPEKKHAFLT